MGQGLHSCISLACESCGDTGAQDIPPSASVAPLVSSALAPFAFWWVISRWKRPELLLLRLRFGLRSSFWVDGIA